jgi:hypothetical protein
VDTVVADLGLEGGGATIIGSLVDGHWLFWYKGSTIALDANDDEEWRYWSTKPSPDLSAALPAGWPLMYPIKLHPEFVGWFRDHYEAACACLREDLRTSQAEYTDRHWQRVFSGVPSSESDVAEDELRT